VHRIFFGVFLDFLVDIQKIHLEKGKIIFLLLFLLLMELHQQWLISSLKGMYSVLYAPTNITT